MQNTFLEIKENINVSTTWHPKAYARALSLNPPTLNKHGAKKTVQLPGKTEDKVLCFSAKPLYQSLMFASQWERFCSNS